jgi:hypothetical protein
MAMNGAQTRAAITQAMVDVLARHPATATAHSGDVTYCVLCSQRSLGMRVEHDINCPVTLARRLREWKASRPSER